jgi:ankyrin repeat protein
LEIVQVLLERGAVIDLQDNDGNTPLLQATNVRLDVVQVLLDGGADVNVNLQNKYGMSPLHSAASDGNLEIVQVLLERGADVNVKNNNGDTPLISAAIGAAATRARLESDHRLEVVLDRESSRSRVLRRRLEVVRVLFVAWMFGNQPSPAAVRPTI